MFSQALGRDRAGNERVAIMSFQSLARAARHHLRPRARAKDAWVGLSDSALKTRYSRWRSRPLELNTVLYESFGGNGALDNPEAIFRYLLGAPDMHRLRHVWVLDSVSSHPRITEEFLGDPRVRFVEKYSPAYFKALACSKFLFNNATFPQEFAKRPGQVYVNTWHGVPLKHMGHDMPHGGPESRNVTRNFLNADYLLSANSYMTETMYRKAYRLQGIFRGAVIEEGHARTDRQSAAAAAPDETRSALEALGLPVGQRKIILYAPTWRGESFAQAHLNAGQLRATVRELEEALDPSEHVVLLKVHQVVYDAMAQRSARGINLVPNDLPTNVLLGVTDLLVTDYSSIFFDFTRLERPIIHYLPDLDDYRGGRGLYLTEDQLPGQVCETVTELVQAVAKGLGSDGRSEPVSRAAAVYNPKDDGAVCSRIVDLVFRGADEQGYTVHRDFGTDKETLLVYLGSLKSQGITTSALSMLRHLDFDRYDVTAFYPYSRGRERLRNAGFIDPRVRVIPRVPVFIGSPPRVRKETRRLMERGLTGKLDGHHRAFWSTEWQRMFGDARFDHLIDFSGYGCYTPFLYSVSPAKQKSIWLHNDMYSDMQRETVGEKHLEDRLQAVFTTYRHFDNLVSVSPQLKRVNSEQLSRYAPAERFTYAVNTIDAERVLRMAGVVEVSNPAPDGLEHATAGSDRYATFDTTNAAAAVAALVEYFPVADIIREARGHVRLPKDTLGSTQGPTFVSVGRLSPEKNHARLIKAFAQVHENHPHIRLVILGGGALEEELAELVLNLGMEGAVTLAGQVDNPFAIMAEADCFVLSSDYEGQPMVILEARTLKLPVITTEFSSVGDSVPPDAGLVVPKTIKGLAAGLEKFLAGGVPSSALDYEEYNRRAMEQFDAAIHHSC